MTDIPTLNDRLADLRSRYEKAAHAVQAGIGWLIQLAKTLPKPEIARFATDPKHVRTGIDTTKADVGAICKLLVEKGVCSEEELHTALVDYMEREKASFEARLSDELKTNVNLH